MDPEVYGEPIDPASAEALRAKMAPQSIVQGSIPGLLGVQMGRQRWPDSPGLWNQFAAGGAPIGKTDFPGAPMGPMETAMGAGGAPINLAGLPKGTGPAPADAFSTFGATGPAPNLSALNSSAAAASPPNMTADLGTFGTPYNSPPPPPPAAAAVPEPGGGFSANASPATGTPAASAPSSPEPRKVRTERVTAQAGGPDLNAPTGSPPGSPPPARRPTPENPASPGTDQPIVPRTSALGRATDAAAEVGKGGPLGLLGKLFGGVGDFARAHPWTLMAMGGGMAGKASLGAGVSSALTAGANMAPTEAQWYGPYGKVAAINSMGDYLRSRGVDEGTIRAAQLNPELGKQLVTNFGNVDTMRKFGANPGTQGTQPTTAQLNAQPEAAQIQILRTMPEGHRLQLADGTILQKRNGQIVDARTGQPHMMAGAQ